jgi:hypothetical protein
MKWIYVPVGDARDDKGHHIRPIDEKFSVHYTSKGIIPVFQSVASALHRPTNGCICHVSSMANEEHTHPREPLEHLGVGHQEETQSVG